MDLLVGMYGGSIATLTLALASFPLFKKPSQSTIGGFLTEAST
ncbi:hypothetical protein OS189_07865 [Sulfitobacter sp. F26169L]|nr:hypothetical protein [Sulfitobacter sp. F26169L]MCX7566256.1 hypothetical protein [Sulfitobacter sp. F26169L]